jgi:CRISPR-associated endonuclease/helicase Cas3
MSSLLAKSPSHGRRITLAQHTRDVVQAARCLYWAAGQPTRLGRQWLRFFKIDAARFEHFLGCLLAAAAFHDWGKANDGFQDAVQGRGRQLVRHEHLGGLMLELEDVRAWLGSRPDIDWDVVLSAVLTHHLKLKNDNELAPMPEPPAPIRLLWQGQEFQNLLREIADELRLTGKLPTFATWWRFETAPGGLSIPDLRHRVGRRLRNFDRALRGDQPRQRLLWAVRAALIAADAAGSGLPRTGKDIPTWIHSVFEDQALYGKTEVEQAVIYPRVADLRRQGHWRDWNQFQLACDRLADRALLLAPCGSGKTLAAWRWIASRPEQRRVSRIIFLYPTRATATEGFRDYVSWAPESDAALMHGTASYDLQGMFTNPADPGDQRQAKDFEVEQRLFALGFWARRIFSATVDQFLAFLQYGYGPVCMLPVLADSVVVVDEVHSFDHGMFSALKDFLNTFDVPVLCMTATLPEARRRELVVDCNLQEPQGGPPEDLRRVATAPRYRVRRVGSQAEATGRAREALAKGLRVLWVVNQVKRAQRLVRGLAQQFGHGQLLVLPGRPLYCYHSRFRLEDRRDRHQAVIRAFQGNAPAALAVCTQVCEMSLDLDADVLVTELAPVTSLIQRMGRCNRKKNLPLERLGDVLLYTPENEEPYGRESLVGLREFLGRLTAWESVSQDQLAEALRLLPAPPAIGDKPCRFLESGPYAMTREETFRDIEEFTVPAVLARDVQTFLDLRAAGEPADGLIVPVPRKWGRPDPGGRLSSFITVAPDSHYHPAIGFCDEPVV